MKEVPITYVEDREVCHHTMRYPIDSNDAGVQKYWAMVQAIENGGYDFIEWSGGIVRLKPKQCAKGNRCKQLG